MTLARLSLAARLLLFAVRQWREDEPTVAARLATPAVRVIEDGDPGVGVLAEIVGDREQLSPSGHALLGRYACSRTIDADATLRALAAIEAAVAVEEALYVFSEGNE